jgi:hypothetical protein
LTKNPASPRGLDCLGEFILRNDLDGFELASQPAAGQLGATVSPALGEALLAPRRLHAGHGDPKAGADDRAYALCRAVNCFAPSGYNDCGTQDVPQEQRRRWFRRFATSRRSSWWRGSITSSCRATDRP